jgi:nicotinamide-nucleotide amidase
LAYLPSPGSVRLRLSCYNGDEKTTPVLFDEKIKALIPLLGNAYLGIENYGEEAFSLEKKIADILTERKWKLALAESCTGGYLSHLFTSIAGASLYFNGALIPYQNEFKNEFLKVDNEIFKKYGAVSEECVLQMATETAFLFNADCSIAISGIAGPTGGTTEKPVGTVWIAVKVKDKIIAKKFTFGDDRGRNILMASQSAMQLLWIELNESA